MEKLEDEKKPEQIKNTSEKLEAPLRLPGFSSASYLWQAGGLITEKLKETKGLLFDPNRSKEEDLPIDFKELIKECMRDASKPEIPIKNMNSQIVNIQKIESLEKQITFHEKVKEKDSTSFDKTQRSRKFFETQVGQGSAKRETYWNTLFFPYNTKETREFAKNSLKDKKILLFGGGRSKIEKEFEEYGVEPEYVTNIDPFVENPEQDLDEIIPLDVSDQKLTGELFKLGKKEVDEIWALYSVPAYLEDPEKIKQLFINIDLMLAPGGNARVWPLEVGGSGNDERNILLQKSVSAGLREMINKNVYEITDYKTAGRMGLILHKKIIETNLSSEKVTQAKIDKIRQELGL